MKRDSFIIIISAINPTVIIKLQKFHPFALILNGKMTFCLKPNEIVYIVLVLLYMKLHLCV